MRAVRGGVIGAAAAACLVAAVTVTAGIAPSPFKPAALVTNNLVMYKGLPFVRVADLAAALGGTVRYDSAGRSCEIQSGPGGALQLNPGPLAAIGGGGDPRHLAQGPLFDRSSLRLWIDGHGVAMQEEERAMLGPGDPAVSLGLLARLLGGKPLFDAGKGAWMLPAGGAATPFRFRR